MKKLLLLAWRQWRRDSRTGELRVLAAALVLAVASVGTVGLFADRVKTAILLLVTALFGATFVGMQAFEWTKLIMEGVRPWGNPWGAPQGWWPRGTRTTSWSRTAITSSRLPSSV